MFKHARSKQPKPTCLHLSVLVVSNSQSPKKGKDRQSNPCGCDFRTIFVGLYLLPAWWQFSKCFPSVLSHTIKETFLQTSFEGLKSVFLHRNTSVLFPLSSSDSKAVPAPLEKSVWDYFSYTEKLYVCDIPLGVPCIEFCFSVLLLSLVRGDVLGKQHSRDMSKVNVDKGIKKNQKNWKDFFSSQNFLSGVPYCW